MSYLLRRYRGGDRVRRSPDCANRVAGIGLRNGRFLRLARLFNHERIAPTASGTRYSPGYECTIGVEDIDATEKALVATESIRAGLILKDRFRRESRRQSLKSQQA